MQPNTFIPFHRPSIDHEEIEEVCAVLESGWLTTGPRTAHFERVFAQYAGANAALGVNSGTAALHLALAALGIGSGDEVITTPMTFCATVNCIMHVGATPVLADIDENGNIDPEQIRQKITPRTRAILPVHYGGFPCEMNEIWTIAREHGLFVIEDAAHAVGTQYYGYPIGAGNPDLGYASDAVAYSFYATKNLATGEGGMLTSHSAEVIDKARVLCLHGISKDAWNRYSERGNWYYQVLEAGFKYNLSDIQSAIGIPQLRKQEKFLSLRTSCARFYNEQFAGMDEFDLPREPENGRHAWHLYPLRLNLEGLTINRAEFIEQLRARGIGASVHFIPIPEHPFFAKHARLKRNRCPEALDMYSRVISLPLYPAMTCEQMESVVHVVRTIARQNRTEKIFPALSAAS